MVMYNEFNDSELDTNLNDGIAQSKSFQYYFGTTEIFYFNSESYGVAILHNPEDSDKVIHINKLSCSNYSSLPIMVEVLTRGDINGNLRKSNEIDFENAKCYEYIKNKAEIIYASKVPYAKGKAVYRRSIMPYDTSDGFPYGSVILYPGSSRIYLFTTIELGEEASASLSFNWWEKLLD